MGAFGLAERYVRLSKKGFAPVANHIGKIAGKWEPDAKSLLDGCTAGVKTMMPELAQAAGPTTPGNGAALVGLAQLAEKMQQEAAKQDIAQQQLLEQQKQTEQSEQQTKHLDNISGAVSNNVVNVKIVDVDTAKVSW